MLTYPLNLQYPGCVHESSSRVQPARPGADSIRTSEARRYFESLTEKIETGSASGKLRFHVFAALAEFERNLIRERTQAGLAATAPVTGPVAASQS